MSKRLAILTHEYYPVLSGGTVFSDKIAHELQKLGWSVDVLTARVGDTFPKIQHDDNVDILRFTTARRSVVDSTLFEHLTYFGLGLPQMFAEAREKHYDLLFSVFAIPSGLMALALTRVLGMPNVVFVDASDTPGIESAMKTYVRYLGPLFRLVTRRAGGVVVLEGLEDLAMPHVKNERVEIIPNGTVIPEEQARPGQNGPTLQLLSIGRLVLRKGFHCIIEALGELKREGVPLHLNIVGYGRAEEEIRATLEQNGVTDIVSFIGRVEHARLKQYFLASDAYLFYGDREGSSLAMIEAAAYGLPVIASDHPGNRTYIKHGQSGFLVPHRDSKALCRAIRHLAEHRAELPAMGQASRTIAEQFSWTEIARRYDAFFTRVMQARGGQRT